LRILTAALLVLMLTTAARDILLPAQPPMAPAGPVRLRLAVEGAITETTANRDAVCSAMVGRRNG
jgi:hypothetical protein